ncbi:MAG: hypothetical protein WDZ29_06530 [Balneolaceae bacterium]
MSEDLEKKLRLKLTSEESRRKAGHIREQNEAPGAQRLIIFFSTLGLLYLLFFALNYLFQYFFGPAIGMFGVNINWVYPLIHGAIWVATIASTYRKRSVLDDMAGRF